MKKQPEKGFALIAALGLTLALTAVGAGSLLNSKAETKYARQAISSNAALEAAKSGINTYFSRVNDPVLSKEIRAIGYYSYTGSATASYGPVPSYYMDLGIDERGQVPSDAFMTNNASKFLIYDITNTGLVQKLTWNPNPKVEQVAVWVETYDAGLSTDNFPYVRDGVSTRHHVTGKATAKQGLSFVVYAIGSYGKERKVLRERVAQGSGYIVDLAAVNNAPRYSNNASLCTDSSVSEDSSSENETDYSDDTIYGGGLIIDSTQSYYTRAIKSNNSVVFPIDPHNDEFDFADAFSSIVAGNMESLVVYDDGKVNKLNYPSVTGSSLPLNAANTVRSDLFGTKDYINYFESASSNLFYINAYREAANRIAGYPNGEILNGYTVNVNVGGMGNSVALAAGNAGHARMGTLSWADFNYNVQHNVPMYGLVRVLIPARLETSDERDDHTNDICGDSDTPRYKSVVFYEETTDSDSHQNPLPPGKMIVYGSVLFDFFSDDDEDGVYNIETDHVLTEKEAMTVSIELKMPMLVNPVADGNLPAVTGITSNYTAVGIYQNGSPSIDMASDASVRSDGIIDTIANIVNLSEGLSTSFYNVSGFKFTDYKSLLSAGSSAYNRDDMFKLLDYYHQTRAYSSAANYSDLKLSNVATNKTNFYIDTKSDSLVGEPSAADAFHVFMPTGYVHGWKRAFDVTGITSGQWNNSLIAIDSPFADIENEIFYLPRVDGKDLINSDFKDVPAIMQTSGLSDFEGWLNVSGIIYSPGTLRFGSVANASTQWQVDPSYYLDDELKESVDQCNSDETGDELEACLANANLAYTNRLNVLVANMDVMEEACQDEDPSDTVEISGTDYYCGSISESLNPVSGQYISGATISGFGTFFEKAVQSTSGDSDEYVGNNRYIIVSYDDVSTDNIPVAHDEMVLRRTHWEEVK